MPEISVIVPVYQAGGFLAPCVESVRGQRFRDWELILVDDGSTDGSGERCEQYAASDPRIRALRLPENRGVSAARNRGLEAARGDWIAFLDADDRYVPETLETLRTLRVDAGADTAGCAHWNVTPDGEESVEPLLSAGVYDREAILSQAVGPLFGERLRAPLFNGFLWRYLFSGEAVRNRGLSFAGAYLEDELFVIEYLCGAQRMAVTERPLYRYLKNPASATRHYMGNLMDILTAYMDRKGELALRYELDRNCPQWRNSSNWANLLIAVANEYARGNPASMKQRQKAVEALCRRPEMDRALRELVPVGLGRNKQVVADLLRTRRFRTLAALYFLKNRMWTYGVNSGETI